MHDLDVVVVRTSTPALVRLVGEFDLAAKATVLDALGPLCSVPSHTMELDLSGLSFIDSSGIAVLIELHHRSTECGGTLLLLNPHPQVLKALKMTAVDSVMTILQGDGHAAWAGLPEDL